MPGWHEANVAVFDFGDARPVDLVGTAIGAGRIMYPSKHGSVGPDNLSGAGGARAAYTSRACTADPAGLGALVRQAWTSGCNGGRQPTTTAWATSNSGAGRQRRARCSQQLEDQPDDEENDADGPEDWYG